MSELEVVDQTGAAIVAVEVPSALALAGHIADRVAANRVFAAFQGRKAPHTRRRHQADLALFRRFLADAGVATGDLYAEPSAWQGVSWGLVAGFIEWQLKQGFAIGSVNVHLYTVKAYARLALQAGTLDHAAYGAIRAVRGLSHREGINIDLERPQTRSGRKKAAAVSINAAAARALKQQPTDSPQGRRDALLLCLLLDHGLRVGEIAALRVEHISLVDGTLRFYRPKVDVTQTHVLTPDTLRAALLYINNDAPPSGLLFPGSRKNRALSQKKMKGGKPKATQSVTDMEAEASGTLPVENGMTAGAITKRVRVLGVELGFSNLSPHDCRHSWASSATRGGTDIKSLQDAGGWKSPAMPLRYVESAAVANAGVKLAD